MFTCSSGLFRFRFAFTSVSAGCCIILRADFLRHIHQGRHVRPKQHRANRRKRIAPAQRIGERDSRPGISVIVAIIARTFCPITPISSRLSTDHPAAA